MFLHRSHVFCIINRALYLPLHPSLARCTSTLVGPIESSRTRLHEHTYEPLPPTSIFFLSPSDARVSSRRPGESRKSNQCRGGELSGFRSNPRKVLTRGSRRRREFQVFVPPRRSRGKREPKTRPVAKRETKGKAGLAESFCRKTIERTVSLRMHDLSLRRNKA